MRKVDLLEIGILYDDKKGEVFKPTKAVYELADKINELIDHIEKLEALTTSLDGGYTKAERDRVAFKQWLQESDIIYRLNSRGQIIEQPWRGDDKHEAVRDFMGIFRTREEAEAHVQRIKSLTKEI